MYRNLQELVHAGLIGTLVWDVYLDQVAVTLDRQRSPLNGFRIDRRDVQLHGLCARCRDRR